MDKSRVPSSTVLDALAESQPSLMIVGVYAGGVEVYFAGAPGFTGNFDNALKAIKTQHPDATVLVYQRNDSPAYQMVGAGAFGEGWYVLCEPADKPRLVRAQRIMNQRPRRLVRGIDVDTGEQVEELAILYSLGTDAEAIAPLRENPALRVNPPYRLPAEMWRSQSHT